LGFAVATVFSIASVESTYLLKKQNLRFTLSYARRQIIPSIVWDTFCPEQLFRELKMDPAKYLRSFDFTKQADIKANGRLMRCRHIRSVLAGFIGIAQIMRVVDMAAKHDETYAENIRTGREPFYANSMGGRVIRFSGVDSHVTEQSMQRFGRHILPIYEQPRHTQVERLVHLYSDQETSNPNSNFYLYLYPYPYPYPNPNPNPNPDANGRKLSLYSGTFMMGNTRSLGHGVPTLTNPLILPTQGSKWIDPGSFLSPREAVRS